MHRIILIARREIVAYASVPSFWVALLMGPMLLLMLALASGSLGRPAAPSAHRIVLQSADGVLRDTGVRSLQESSRLEHRTIAFGDDPATAETAVAVADGTDGALRVEVRGRPLSGVAQALLSRDLAEARRAERRDVAAPAPVRIVQPAVVRRAGDAGRFARFSVTVMLWLVLVGSLGMLLQAIVRERTNRALESLLSAARPSDILLGKLMGVGALALLVMAVWAGGSALVAASPLARGAAGPATMLAGLGGAAAVVRGVVLFVLTFAMYGSALIGLGAIARDVPAAQNLARPVFGLLLLIFMLALSQLVGMNTSAFPLLVMLPPFTPFVLLLAKPGSIDALHTAVGLGGMLAVTVTCVCLGSNALRGEFTGWRWFGRRGAPA